MSEIPFPNFQLSL